MEKSMQAHLGKAPRLVFIQPISLPQEKAEQLLQIVSDGLKSSELSAIGGVIAGVSLEGITLAVQDGQANMTINIHIHILDTT